MLILTDWYQPDQVPARSGWYLRDHRGVTMYDSDEDRRICMDFWEADDKPGSICFPGVWYVLDDAGLNDASQQHLPWCGVIGC